MPNDYHLIKCDGKYLMPGLIDIHVPISDDGDMLKFLKYGVTTVRLFNKCGMPNFETLKSATIVAATALGLEYESSYFPGRLILS